MFDIKVLCLAISKPENRFETQIIQQIMLEMMHLFEVLQKYILDRNCNIIETMT